MKPFALAGSSHTDGVERTNSANVPGKSELQIGEIGTFTPEGLEGRFWADRREAVPYGSFGFNPTVPGVGKSRPANTLKRPVHSGDVV